MPRELDCSWSWSGKTTNLLATCAPCPAVLSGNHQVSQIKEGINFPAALLSLQKGLVTTVFTVLRLGLGDGDWTSFLESQMASSLPPRPSVDKIKHMCA